jgi:hypothetical protein
MTIALQRMQRCVIDIEFNILVGLDDSSILMSAGPSARPPSCCRVLLCKSLRVLVGVMLGGGE